MKRPLCKIWAKLKRSLERNLCLPTMLKTYTLSYKGCIKGPRRDKRYSGAIPLPYLKGLSPLNNQDGRKLTSRKSYPSFNWKSKEKEGSRKDNSPMNENEPSQVKALLPTSSSKSTSIKCFKCLGKSHITSQYPHRRTMILRENRKVSESLQEDFSFLSERLMSSLVGETKTQGENIFHFKCLVLEKLCSIIINGENSVTVARLKLVEKLSILTFLYPKSYKLGKLVVDKQVSLAFTLGSYMDEIVCDVVSMEATHILLGRS
ncbi:hypothetical protein CR513_15978, partial [Mucuna pruriens]